MPEGPEMRRAATELDAVLRGRRAQLVYFKFPRHRAAARRLEGRKIRAVRARGKALILDFDNGESIYTHNQLYGKWLVGKSGRRPITARDLRLAIETAASAALASAALEITRRAFRTDGITNDSTVAQRMKRAGHRYAEYRHYVFDRGGQPCHRCGSIVQRIMQSGRQLYRCIRCQPPAASSAPLSAS